ncbi:MAG: HAD family hydrolase [Pseudomonadota bacterium]
MTLPRPTAILFDWDNTLVNTWPLIHAALNMTMRHMGHPEWTYEKVTSVVKQSMRDSFPDLFGDRWKEAADFYQTSYRSMHLEKLEPLPDVLAMLAAIKRRTTYVGIVSNKQGPTLRKEIEALGWEDYFDVAVGASDAPRDKPHADPVLLALKDTGIEPAADVWFIGDTGVDLAVAQATGCTPILYGPFTTDGASHDGFPFRAHVRDHVALKALIEMSM